MFQQPLAGCFHNISTFFFAEIPDVQRLFIENDEIQSCCRHNTTDSRAVDKTSASLQTIYVTTLLTGCHIRVLAVNQRSNDENWVKIL